MQLLYKNMFVNNLHIQIISNISNILLIINLFFFFNNIFLSKKSQLKKFILRIFNLYNYFTSESFRPRRGVSEANFYGLPTNMILLIEHYIYS